MSVSLHRVLLLTNQLNMVLLSIVSNVLLSKIILFWSGDMVGDMECCLKKII